MTITFHSTINAPGHNFNGGIFTKPDNTKVVVVIGNDNPTVYLLTVGQSIWTVAGKQAPQSTFYNWSQCFHVGETKPKLNCIIENKRFEYQGEDHEETWKRILPDPEGLITSDNGRVAVMNYRIPVCC